MDSFFKIKNLSFNFDDSKKERFFSNVSCEFKQNKLNFIRGKNGAGKSTLFRIMMGKVEPIEFIEGIVTIKDQSFNLAIPEQRQKLSANIRLAPQKFDQMLADQFTFAQNMQLAALPRYPRLKRFIETTTIPHIVERFGIDYDVPVGMLSGGQRQILAILMALQKPASILLLDEPTAALDDKNSSMVMSFLNELLTLNKELTILIICHDLELVGAYTTKHYYQIEVNKDLSRTLDLISLNHKGTP